VNFNDLFKIIYGVNSLEFTNKSSTGKGKFSEITYYKPYKSPRDAMLMLKKY
jgi:hypothetical protein